MDDLGVVIDGEAMEADTHEYRPIEDISVVIDDVMPAFAYVYLHVNDGDIALRMPYDKAQRVAAALRS